MVEKPLAAKKPIGPAALSIDEELAQAALDRVEKEVYEVQEAFFRTGLKVGSSFRLLK